MERKSEAIVLKRTAYGEADLIVTFLDREAGRLSGIAKSARRSARRFGGALEPGTKVLMRYTMRPGAGFARLSDASVLRGAMGLARSLGRISAMASAVELALAFLKEGQPAGRQFDLLDSWLAFLSESEPSVEDELSFELKWLSASGFAPNLGACTGCGSAEATHFDFARGGVVCRSCSALSAFAPRLSEEALRVMRGGGGGHQACAEAKALVSRYVESVLGRPMRAIALA